jgi:hypothetical protein
MGILSLDGSLYWINLADSKDWSNTHNSWPSVASAELKIKSF